MDGSRTRVPGGRLKHSASPLYQVYQGQFRFSATTRTLAFTVYVAANRLSGWRSLTETPPGNVIADAIHSRMFCAPRLTNAYHFSRHSYSAFSAALDPNGTTVLTIAVTVSGIQASE